MATKYPNLSAEMARTGKSAKNVSEVLGCSENTVYRRLSGSSELSLDSARRIRDKLFPGMTLEYLFERSGDAQV